ncbi:protein BTG1-like [Hydractinia symbiolongicarpus]|uniref:protein BTG1-like n=1 Tax=Hydractinia symbiolongicarpus TaxID=13093 RepID=UPI00254CD5F8|nr:protein BTG1-like [Hydractinia symbiolongicarpus]
MLNHVKSNKMDVEIQVAVQFIISFLVGKFSEEELSEFVEQLCILLSKKFKGHWYPEKPSKGSAYRCLSIERQLDTLLIHAAQKSQLSSEDLFAYLPKKLDLWIDPTEVSYRIGEHGHVIMIYKEGDDCVNSTSEYLAKVLNQLPTVTPKEPVNNVNQSKHYNVRTSTVTSAPLINAPQVNMSTRRMENHLSPSAKSFVSRSNKPLNFPFLNNRPFPQAMNPLLNLDYLQKLQWPLLATGRFDPIAAQLLQNYLIMQELQRFETRRLALQSHYLKMQNLRWPKKSHHNHNRQQSSSGNAPTARTSGVQIPV